MPPPPATSAFDFHVRGTGRKRTVNVDRCRKARRPGSNPLSRGAVRGQPRGHRRGTGPWGGSGAATNASNIIRPVATGTAPTGPLGHVPANDGGLVAKTADFGRRHAVPRSPDGAVIFLGEHSGRNRQSLGEADCNQSFGVFISLSIRSRRKRTFLRILTSPISTLLARHRDRHRSNVRGEHRSNSQASCFAHLPCKKYLQSPAVSCVVGRNWWAGGVPDEVVCICC